MSLPPQVLAKMIEVFGEKEPLVQQTVKKINPNLFLEYPPLLEKVICANKKAGNFKANNDIHRSISILCKDRP